MRFAPRNKEEQTEIIFSGYPLWFSRLLSSRGITTSDEAERFLRPSLEDMHDPLLLLHMADAVSIIKDAVSQNHKVVIWGDYDADGICAAAIIWLTLRTMGLEASVYLPDRHMDGYGLNKTVISDLAADNQVLLTVDCGITNHDEVAHAKSLGMTVILTDHHQLPERLPPADAILHPMLNPYPFPSLCGSGVAYKLSQALIGVHEAIRFLPLCALATMADIVPLTGENRVIVTHGLLEAERTDLIGMCALLKECDCHPPYKASDFAFRLAPRINAAGRMGSPLKSFTLLVTGDTAEAEEMACLLSVYNNERRDEQVKIFNEALCLVDHQVDFRHDKAIIIMSGCSNLGLVGLTAGMLCDKFHYPAIVLTETEDGILSGSARSINGINVFNLLTHCADVLIRFGGHSLAAGLTIKTEKLPEFRLRMTDAIIKTCDLSCYLDVKAYDITVPLTEINMEMLRYLTALEPTGCGNPAPVLRSDAVSVSKWRFIGQGNKHLSLSFCQDGNRFDGVFFSCGLASDSVPQTADILYTPVLNTYMGRSSVRLTLDAINPSDAITTIPDTAAFTEALILDLTTWISYESSTDPLPENTSVHKYDLSGLSELIAPIWGTLVISRTRTSAGLFAQHLPVYKKYIDDVRGFSSVLLMPDLTALNDRYDRIVLSDGVISDAEVQYIKHKCPGAVIYAPLTRVHELEKMLLGILPDDGVLRRVYQTMRSAHGNTLAALSEKRYDELSRAQLHLILLVFAQLGLIAYDGSRYNPLTAEKCHLEDSRLVRDLRRLTDRLKGGSIA